MLIHYEPRRKTQLRYAVALANYQGGISEHFGESPYFALVDMDMKEKRVQRQELVANPHLGLVKGRGMKVAEFLLSHKPDVVVAKESLSGKGFAHAFTDAGVETRRTETESLRELVNHLVLELS